MASIRKYGYSHGPKVIVTAKVSNTNAIADGDIVCLDAADAVASSAGAGYIKAWVDQRDEVLGVAMESCDAPTTDGDVSIQIVLALPGTVFTFAAASIAQKYCFQKCDIDGKQSIDYDKDMYQNVWIVGVDEDNGLADVILLGVFGAGATGASYASLDYGSS